MSKSNSLVEGLLWIGGGSAVTALTYSLAGPGGTYVIAWGAIVYGGFKLIFSLAEGPSEHEQEGLTYKDKVRLGQELTIRAMYFIASAAGGYAGARGRLIDTIAWRICDTPIDPGRMAEWRKEIDENSDRFLDEIRAKRDVIPQEFKGLLIESADQVASADGATLPEAKARLLALTAAIGASPRSAAETS